MKAILFVATMALSSLAMARAYDGSNDNLENYGALASDPHVMVCKTDAGSCAVVGTQVAEPCYCWLNVETAPLKAFGLTSEMK